MWQHFPAGYFPVQPQHRHFQGEEQHNPLPQTCLVGLVTYKYKTPNIFTKFRSINIMLKGEIYNN